MEFCERVSIWEQFPIGQVGSSVQVEEAYMSLAPKRRMTVVRSFKAIFSTQTVGMILVAMVMSEIMLSTVTAYWTLPWFGQVDGKKAQGVGRPH